jgi:hypothetical protein
MGWAGQTNIFVGTSEEDRWTDGYSQDEGIIEVLAHTMNSELV